MRMVIEVLGGSVGGLYKRFRPPPARQRRPLRLVYTIVIALTYGTFL